MQGDGDSAEKHREFYDEYLAVMDLTAEFYLETVDRVFVKHLLPKGEMTHRGKPVDLEDIRRTGLMTIEGENDDISGVGQTQAAQRAVRQYPGRKARPLSAKGASGITACSTARASAARSCRASTTSSSPERRRQARKDKVSQSEAGVLTQHEPITMANRQTEVFQSG